MKKPMKPVEKTQSGAKPNNVVEVTEQNAAKLMVHFLSAIHSRMGYMIKLMEEQKARR